MVVPHVIYDSIKQIIALGIGAKAYVHTIMTNPAMSSKRFLKALNDKNNPLHVRCTKCGNIADVSDVRNGTEHFQCLNIACSHQFTGE